MKRGKCFIVCMLVCSMALCSCSKEEKKSKPVKQQIAVVDSDTEKGYDLPVAAQEKDEAERESCQLMALLTDIYKNADKGNSLRS